ncbi:hypothetical protein BDF22DRAFT_726822 [Syncephalis plumigaleata]|nr:hypothetical protein BDF22DRAFT_726822 [Syncephalis plumigaleata]
MSSIPLDSEDPPHTTQEVTGHTLLDEKKSKSNNKDKSQSIGVDEHLMTLEAVSERYKVSINERRPAESAGLDTACIEDRVKQYGANVLTPPKRTHPLIVYGKYLMSLFNVLLLLYLGAILFGVAFLNAFIEFYQHQKTAAILESFLNMIPQQCYVIRDGRMGQLPASELVPGDVVFVRMGDKVPADLLDNSSLTGESEPQPRTKENDHKNPLEASNIAFNGTLAVAGEGYGIVIRTGDNTVLGQIAGMTAGESSSNSPLSVEVARFVKTIATIAAITGLIFFVVGLILYDNNVSFCLNFAIGVFLGWVPEGLPATMTMLLTFAAKRMASRNVLVKDLQGVETLGAITLLATDKTGTLTRNQMTVTYIWSAQQFYSAQRNPWDETNPLTPDAPGIPEILHISTLCSRAKFDRTDVPVEERQILADATEAGLIRFAGRHLDHFDRVRDDYPKVFEIPFNSDNKWALTIHRKKHANGELTLYIKGAPERVLRLCSSILSNNGPEPLTATHQEKYNEIYEYMASKGHRVLAFAQLLLPGNEYPADYEFSKDPTNYPTGNYCFVGLASLEDPPKHGVREAIGRCRAAGIQVMMVTINLMLSETKPQVAKRLGRPVESIEEHEYQAIVIHGEQIDSFADEDWDRVFSKNEIIFARTSPRHKLEIVRHAQSLGHIVSVTGDGADLGIAMNISGSDVSKEAAAMILLDDNFASTVNGIEEGRLIFTNLKKSIQYTITHSMPEVYAALLYIVVPGLMKMPPRKPVTETSIAQLRRQQARRLPDRIDEESGEAIRPTRGARLRHTLSNLVSATWWHEQMETTEGEVLVDGNVLSWAYLEMGTIEAAASARVFGEYYVPNAKPLDIGGGKFLSADEQVEVLAQAQTCYYMGVMIIQLFNLFACKCRLRLPFGRYMFSNPYNFYGALGGFTLCTIVSYVPFMNVAFGTSYKTPIYLHLISAAFGVFLVFYATLRTLIRRRSNPTRWNPVISGLRMHATVYSTSTKD